jgi:hypothetical protein
VLGLPVPDKPAENPEPRLCFMLPLRLTVLLLVPVLVLVSDPVTLKLVEVPEPQLLVILPDIDTVLDEVADLLFEVEGELVDDSLMLRL